MQREVLSAVHEAAKAEYRATLAIHKYVKKLNVVGEELRRDYKKAVYISNTTSYGKVISPATQDGAFPSCEALSGPLCGALAEMYLP